MFPPRARPALPYTEHFPCPILWISSGQAHASSETSKAGRVLSPQSRRESVPFSGVKGE